MRKEFPRSRVRQLLLALGICSALLPVTAGALGVGGIEVKSALNQNFQARIELLSVGANTELDDIHVALASSDAFARAGVDRPFILASLRFKVVQGSDGKIRVDVSSIESIREPFLTFLVEINWPSGRMLREYTVLLDLPVKPASSTPVVKTARNAAATTTPAPRRVTPTTTQSPRYTGSSYGPTRRTDTLWAIARDVRGDRSLTTEQVMMALVDANPDAFFDGNANLLKKGRILRVPGEEAMQSRSRREAHAEFMRQTAAWRAGKVAAQAETAPRPVVADSTPAIAEPVTPEPAAGSEETAAPEPAAAGEEVAGDATQLRLLAPDMEGTDQAAAPGVEAAGGELGAEVDQLRQELAMATETTETALLENSEMRARMTEMEDRVTEMQRLFAAKDQQLATMQKQLAAGDAAAAPAAADTSAAQDADTPPVKQTTGMLQEFLNQPYMVAIVGVVALVLGMLGVIMVRRRRQSEMSYGQSFGAASATTAIAGDDDGTEDSLSTPFLDKVKPSDMNPVDDVSSADPLAEAEVYVAYGRFQQADELLQDAVKAEPARSDLKIKLFEVYHATLNRGAFEALAGQYHEELSIQAPDDWSRIVGMGHELCPDNALFANAAGSDDDAVLSDSLLEEMRESDHLLEPVDSDMSSQPDDGVLDFSDAGEPVDIKADDRDDNILDFDLGTDADKERDNTLEFDLGDGTGESTGDEVFDNVDSSGEKEDIPVRAAGASEVDTKLDLARAYLDIGDSEGARGILGEVIDQGNNTQKDQAQVLLKELP